MIYLLTRTSSRRQGSELEMYANQRHIVRIERVLILLFKLTWPDVADVKGRKEGETRSSKKGFILTACL